MILIGNEADGRPILEQLVEIGSGKSLEQQRVTCASALSLALLALPAGDSKTAKWYLEKSLVAAQDSTDPKTCATSVTAALTLASLHEVTNDKADMQHAYRMAIDKGQHTGVPQAIDQAAYAALLLGFSIEYDDVARIDAFRTSLDFAMKTRSEAAQEIAKLAAGGIIPLGFTAYRHPEGKARGQALESESRPSAHGDWFAINLKLDESRFFSEQIRAHQRYHKLMFFYISAFLSSARSVTFHMQKLLAHLPDSHHARQQLRWTQSVGQNRGHVKSGSCCLKRLQ